MQRTAYRISNKMKTIYVFDNAGEGKKLIKKIQRNIYSANRDSSGMKMVSYNNKWYYIHVGYGEFINGKLKWYHNRVCIFVGKG